MEEEAEGQESKVAAMFGRRRRRRGKIRVLLLRSFSLATAKFTTTESSKKSKISLGGQRQTFQQTFYNARQVKE